MAVDMFLKLSGIEGESTDSKHKGEIEIESFSWGASNSGSAAHGGGAGAGKVSMQDFSFTTAVSKASPKLFLACASGEHLSSAHLMVRSAGERQQEFYKVTMSDILISSYKQDGTEGGEVPSDQVSLNFSKIEVSYSSQRPDGALGETVGGGWDLAKNVKI